MASAIYSLSVGSVRESEIFRVIRKLQAFKCYVLLETRRLNKEKRRHSSASLTRRVTSVTGDGAAWTVQTREGSSSKIREHRF